MGLLKSDTTYIYEHVDGITYARELGASSSSRFEVGRTLERQERDFISKEDKLWHEIRLAALGNEELKFALDRVKIIYELSRKDYEQE